MRNLKKIVAVLLTVALLASMMVSALAAVTNTDKALKLQQIGLMAGTEADLKLEDGLNRIQGLTFAIRAAGKEAAALAMTDADVATELAKFTDAATIPAWGKKYAAYAIKNNITVGIGGGKFAAMNPISATSFLVFVLKSGMGYADVTTANVIDKAVEAKVLSAGQAVALALKASLIRDDAAGILYTAVSTGVTADGKALIQALIDANAVDAAKAATAGFVAPAPATLKVLSATATNLKEIVVAFDAAVGKTEAEKIANYTVDVGGGVAKAKLNADGKSVTLILTNAMANQATFKVTVKTAVKSDAGVALVEDTTVSGSVFDVTIPVALSATQAGPDSFKVTFSEPVLAPTGVNFKVDNGLYFVQSVTAGDDGYSATVKLYTTLPVGEHKVEVTGVKDHATYSVVTTNLTFAAAKDEVAPTVNKIVSASPEKVVIEFSEDIYAVTSLADIASKIYHTNSANVATTASISGKELTLTFSNKLPNGTAYLTITKEIIKDGWNNKNAVVTDLAIAVTVDTTKPVVKTVEAKTDKQIVITFSEDLQAGNGTYKILDAAGKDVTGDYTITPTRTATTLTLDFNKALPGSTYTVVIEGLKDLAGNEIDKVSTPVAVTDTTAPVVTTAGILYGSKKIVKISANEVMKSEDLLNLANYQVGSTYLAGTKVTASIADGGKAVLLDLSKETTINAVGSVTVNVGKIRDAAGNYTANFITTVTCNDVDASGIAITKVEATGKKTIVVTLADALSTFEADDFIVNNATVGGVSFANNADGKGVITFTITEDLTTTAVTTPGAANITVSTSTGGINSANAFGVKVAANATSGNAGDKISAEITSAVFTSSTAITVTFSENIKADTLSRFTFTVSGNTVTAATVGSNSIELTLKDAVTVTGTKVTLTQVLNIEDSQGNVTSGLTKEITK